MMIDKIIQHWDSMDINIKKFLLFNSADQNLAKQMVVNNLNSILEKNDTLEIYYLLTDILLYIWEKEPCNTEVANLLLIMDQHVKILDNNVAQLMHEMLRLYKKPDSLNYFLRIWQSQDKRKIRNFLYRILKDDQNLFWISHAMRFVYFDLDSEFINFLINLSLHLPENMLFVSWILKADKAMLDGDMATAEKYYSRLVKYGFASYNFRLSKLKRMEKKYDQAIFYLRQGLQRYSWQITYWLVLYDLLKDVYNDSYQLEGKIALLLYSYNKANDLDNTLSSLFKSDLNGADLFLLLNGCYDDSLTIATKWQGRWKTAFDIIDLPVNIGAPAARNWLMQDERVNQNKWVIYLDDDVLVPLDWMRKLSMAVKYYPDAWVWGCKVVDGIMPLVVQQADIHFIPIEQQNIEKDIFCVTTPSFTAEFEGAYDYLRPCNSVTGCCHLFALDRLHEIGPFDLRFSPSQFDDVDHDIRILLNQKQVVYNGHVIIKHMRRSGNVVSMSRSQRASADANYYKLQNKYTYQQLNQILKDNLQQLKDDFLKKYNLIKKFV